MKKLNCFRASNQKRIGTVVVVIVFGFSTTCVISAYHRWSWEFESRLWRDVPDTTLCDKVCQWLATGRWFSRDTPVSSTSKTERQDIAEILLKVALNTITLTLLKHCEQFCPCCIIADCSRLNQNVHNSYIIYTVQD